jgi:hypothetical protein
MTKVMRARQRTMQAQGGRCYYCAQPMWAKNADHFVARFGVSKRNAAEFQCTAEHLTPRSTGGTDDGRNIVAACRFCNRTRHRAKRPLAPEAFRAKVRQRVADGRWNAALIRTSAATACASASSAAGQAPPCRR